jgi:hypothetical protein
LSRSSYATTCKATTTTASDDRALRHTLAILAIAAVPGPARDAHAAPGSRAPTATPSDDHPVVQRGTPQAHIRGATATTTINNTGAAALTANRDRKHGASRDRNRSPNHTTKTARTMYPSRDGYGPAFAAAPTNSHNPHTRHPTGNRERKRPRRRKRLRGRQRRWDRQGGEYPHTSKDKKPPHSTTPVETHRIRRAPDKGNPARATCTPARGRDFLRRRLAPVRAPVPVCPRRAWATTCTRSGASRVAR